MNASKTPTLPRVQPSGRRRRSVLLGGIAASTLSAALGLAGCGAEVDSQEPGAPDAIGVIRGAGGGNIETLSAMQKCLQGLAPDYAETVSHLGGQVGVSYPAGDNPQNAIFPGDVVKVTVAGRVRYSLWGHEAGPGGTGAVAPAGWPFPGLGQVSSIANWNNNPGGWVGSPMQTTALGACTAAPSGYPVRLLYYINDGELWDNGGQWDIRTQVYRAPGRIAIEGVEVTQGIQTAGNLIPLIGGKRTFVRVFVRATDDGRGPFTGVGASLSVEGLGRVYAPIGSPTITASLTGSDRRSLGDSFLFELEPGAITAGSRRLTVTVTPPAGRGAPVTQQAAATFSPSVGLTVLGARYSYYNIPPEMQAQLGIGSWWQARPASAWEPMRITAEGALPLGQLAISELAPTSPWGSASIDCRAVRGGDGRWGCAGYVDGRSWAERTVDARCPAGGCWLALLQPELDDGHHGAHWMTPRGNHAINLQGERVAAEQGLTLAHEIGHGLTLGHTWEDPAYPRRDGGMGPYVALRYAPSLSLVAGQSVAGATTAFDLMSYASPAWFSPYSYCKALAVSSGGRIACPTATPR